MIVLSLRGVRKAFGGNEVLRDVSMTLQDRQRMGLVGVNGCGKSTLLRILAGLETADGGEIALQKGLRVGYLEQQGRVTPGNTVFEELRDVFAPVMAMEERMRAIEAEMEGADEAALDRLGREYAALSDAFEAGGGYGWRSSVLGVLAGLGFTREQHDQPADSLSGGELTRLCLSRLLLQRPDVLLLDEPTNHLDLSALQWLENYLSQYRGAVIVVSHDRYFLDRVCDGVTEILLGRAEQYAGNYTRYIEQRAGRMESRMRAYELQQKEIARQEQIIARYRSFNREKSIRAAESREKALEKIERLERPQEEKQVRFSFRARRRTGEDALILKGVAKSFGARTLFSGVSLHLRAGDRVALIGANGIGKSTLLRCIVGQEKPDAGFIRLGSNADIGYYDQHQRDLSPDKTVLNEVWDRFPRLTQSEVRGALGLFLFSGDDVFMPVHTLSGGERGRVALTELMLRGDNVLLLDEPTNHLDMDSREMLEQALDGFEGTILAISHDRYFINRFATRVAVLTAQGLCEYAGNYDDYQARISRGQEPGFAPGGMTRTEIEKQRRRSREALARVKAARARVEALESQITAAEENIAALEARMALPETYADPDRAAQTAREYQSAQEALAHLYADWETADEQARALEEG